MDDNFSNFSFYKNTLTRRTIIQIIYQNHFNYCENLDYYVSDSYEFGQNIFNKNLFFEIVQEVFNLWSEYDNIAQKMNFDFLLISYVARSIIKAGIAEIKLNRVDYKIILNDYIKISKEFCEKEQKIINKILDLYIKELIL